jgi:hypothetical protein
MLNISITWTDCAPVDGGGTKLVAKANNKETIHEKHYGREQLEIAIKDFVESVVPNILKRSSDFDNDPPAPKVSV